MVEISIMKSLNKNFKINYPIHQEWLRRKTWQRRGIWAEAKRMTRNFLRGQGHSRLSKDTQIYPKPLLGGNKSIYTWPQIQLISKKRHLLAWCSNSSSCSIKINRPIPSEERGWGVDGSPQRTSKEPQCSPERTGKQLTSFNWILPDKALWKPTELS